jgi:hypothetical protein
MSEFDKRIPQIAHGFSQPAQQLSGQELATKISCEIIQKAYEDLSDPKEAENAFHYFNSPEFIRHCNMTPTLNPEYLLQRKLAYSKEFIQLSIKTKKSRHLVGASSKDFKRTTSQILKDFEKAKKIIKRF